MASRISGRSRAAIALASVLALAAPASANDLGENAGWQFRSSADAANLASIADVIQRRKAGAYATPTYVTSTTVDHQYNCGVSASTVGTSGSQTALANSPTVTGATATSQGNASTTSSLGSATSTTGQTNAGTVFAGTVGGTSANVEGIATQALNSTQTNSGIQSASVSGSTACTFGALN